MTSRNDVTGDELKSKSNSDKYREGWDRIFGKKKNEPVHPDLKNDDKKDEAPVR